MKIIGIIQAHAKTFAGGPAMVLQKVEEETIIEMVINRLKKIKRLNEIVIAVPDVKENLVFQEIANKKNVKCFMGNKDDVCIRLTDCAEKYEADVIVHVIGNEILLNPDVLENMIKILGTVNLEAVLLSQSPFLGGGSVITYKALKKACDLIHQPGVDNSYIIRPMAYIRLNTDKFNLKIIDPVLPSEYEIEKAKEILLNVLEEATDVDLKNADKRDLSISKYEFAIKYLLPTDTVLDVACASGGGTYLLSAYCEKAIGVDISVKDVEKANNRYNNDNLRFYVGDATNLNFLQDKTIDKITSFDTIEHIKNDLGYAQELGRVLKDGGLLIISTPRKIGDYIINPYHVREYTKKELSDVLDKGGFTVYEYNSLLQYTISKGENNESEGFLWVCGKKTAR
ncbi:methyltransferase domain-containing protein [Pelotomaculum isophthalicicum JI]|uniref:Methyltransferase domain-containing protein n=1 Tax=Pelotomaculum isophthalicicum JI TaxID=947010 RepID=A0A9X4JUF8_9FIRM|nr:methyltransferase domain-containing protein [Pelotomaculum isophthalicicum]MDF9409145.1 methyltransferase domain-containing protein [Pelotomaculum isophthalicicum JI]